MEHKSRRLKAAELESRPPNPRHIFGRPYFHVAMILIAAAFLVYSNTLKSPFVFDDLDFIVDNPELRDLAILWPPAGTRWLGFLTFALNYRLGGLNTVSYHLANLTIHIFNSLLIYFFLVFTFKTPFMQRALNTPLSVLGYCVKNVGSRGAAGNVQAVFTAFTSALLFACHPIQIQAVTYIWQRITSLATMFYLLSLVFYIKARLLTDSTGQRVTSNERRVKPYAPGAVLYAVSLLSAVLAMKTKEISFTLPFVITLYEFSFFSNDRAATSKRLLYLLPFIFTLLIIPLSVVGPELGLYRPGANMSEYIRTLEIKDLKTISNYDYLLTQSRVIVTYIRLLFFPINQNFDYEYPVFTSFFNLQVFLSLMLHLSLLSLALYLYSKSWKSDKEGRHWLRLIGFGIFWFYLTLSVESSIIPIKDVIFEHRLYLPSAGFFLALMSGIQMFRIKWESTKKALTYSLVVLIAVFSVATYNRNALWKDIEILYENVVRKSPNKAEPHINLGVVYENKGDINGAIEQYSYALRLKADYAEAHANLGNAYSKKGLTAMALDKYMDALKVDPEYADAHYNLGLIYQHQGKTDKAIDEYKTLLKTNPGNADAHNNLGLAYRNQGRNEKAIEEYASALKINPDHAEAHYNLGNSFVSKGHFDKAIREYHAALRVKPAYADTHNNLGACYARSGRLNEAIKEFQEALRLDPNNIGARMNLDILTGK